MQGALRSRLVKQHKLVCREVSLSPPLSVIFSREVIEFVMLGLSSCDRVEEVCP